MQNDRHVSSKPAKEKTTKAERRAIQEAQRAAKAAAKGVLHGSIIPQVKYANQSIVFILQLKRYMCFFNCLVSSAEGNKVPGAGSSAVTSVNVKPAKGVKAALQKNDSVSVAASEKKVADRPVEKDRKKDVPQPRMQYDDKSRVEKAKRRAVVYQTEARNRVELFRHLPQYEHGTQLPDLESKFFQLDPVHPAVYKVSHLTFCFAV